MDDASSAFWMVRAGDFHIEVAVSVSGFVYLNRLGARTMPHGRDRDWDALVRFPGRGRIVGRLPILSCVIRTLEPTHYLASIDKRLPKIALAGRIRIRC
jgi:hypothetical protein